VDAGVESGSVIGGNFDSLLAKLIVTGEDRKQALERSRRALDEMVADGLATALPFHRAIVRDPAYTGEPFTVHTRWIETEWQADVEPFSGGAGVEAEAARRETVVVEVNGKRVEISLPEGLGAGSPAAATKAAPKRRGRSGGGAAAGGDALTSPMQGTIVKIAVEEGQEVAEGDLVVVLEAMKMEQPLSAHKSGTVTGLAASVGDVVTSGAVICEIKG
jgi:acetyl-CoA/propionyl-CoA carboxylase biotin carboxyl carrier protein